MKRILQAVCLFFLLLPGCSFAVVTDACTEATSATLPNPPWTNIEGTMAYDASGFCYYGGGNAVSIYTGTSFSAGQYSQAKLTVGNGGAVLVRGNGSGNYYWWVPYVSSSVLISVAFGGNAPITMTTPCPTVSTGDVIKLAVDSAYNFICTDVTTGMSGAGHDGGSTYASGSPGFYTQVGSPIINFQADNFTAPAATPTFSPPGPRLPTGGGNVTISCSTASPTMYYTTDGSTPTTGSTVYSTPVSITSSLTLKAICTASGYTTSAVASEAYVVGSLTWYIRPDGGPRYSATYNPSGDSCDGSGNAAMVVSGGPNQHCGFFDPRYVWADGSAAGLMLMISGDTMMLADTYPGGQTAWRFAGRAGPNSGDLFNNYQGFGAGDPYTDYNINLPAGTSGAHTKILGANYASCGPGQKTNIFGGYAVLAVINLQQTSYVDVQCLDITDHNDCIKYGTAGLPSVCQNVVPYSDYANSGIITVTNDATAGLQLPGNILLQDVDMHGFPSSGISGAIGGPWTLTRVTSSRNGFAGWNFDFGSAGHGYPNNPAATINAQYVTMDWNGCNAEYPEVDPIPITYCYSIDDGGFGDAFSGQDSNLASMTCNHCELAWNVKDAFFGPHTAIAATLITNSAAFNNGGQTWKANMGASGTWLMQNTLTNANCRRLSQPVTGAPAGFNTYIVSYDLCRADGAAISLVWPVTGSFEIDNSTFVAASTNVSFDLSCWNAFATVSVPGGSTGTGFTSGDIGSLLYVGGTQATVMITSVSGGAITGVSLVSGGQVTNSSVPFTETYVFGGSGIGAQITVNTVTPQTCNGGPRILRNVNFLGYTNTTNPEWNSQAISAFCYSGCAGSPGSSTDAMWTTRSNNYFYGYTPGSSGACTYAGEVCGDPLMTVEPSQTWTNETQLDPFTPTLTASVNAFYPSLSSPLIGAGTNYSGIDELDYYGVATTNPPVIGGVNALVPTAPRFGGGTKLGLGVVLP